MGTVVFLPGIMSSVLKNVAGKIVWPPTITEAISGLDDLEWLFEPSRLCCKPLLG